MIKCRGGFTLIELMITMVVMVILTALAVVAVGNIQAQARDNERKSEIESIARGLDQRYKQGISYTVNGNAITRTPGSYPGDAEMWDWGYWRAVPNDKIFVGVSDQGLTSPSGERLGYICALAGFNMPACDKAEKPQNVEGAFANGSGGWKDTYMYESMNADGRYCNNDPNYATDSCVRFNLYWISETDKSINPKYPNIPGLKIVKSKHQQ